MLYLSQYVIDNDTNIKMQSNVLEVLLSDVGGLLYMYILRIIC